MSPPKEEIPVDERMKRLERRAKVIRSRLLRAVDALDARRHHVVEIGEHAKEVAKPAALSLLGIAALFGASVFAFGLALKARRRRSLSYRLSQGISRLDLGKRLNLVPKPSMARTLFEKVALSVMTFAATELAKRLAQNLVDGRMPDGRLAVGKALDQHHARLSHAPSNGGV